MGKVIITHVSEEGIIESFNDTDCISTLEYFTDERFKAVAMLNSEEPGVALLEMQLHDGTPVPGTAHIVPVTMDIIQYLMNTPSGEYEQDFL